MNLVKVSFFGALATDLGCAEWALAVTSPAEALQAIEANTGKMVNALLENAKSDYHVFINGVAVKNVEELTIMQRSDLKSIEFMPAFKGAGDNGGWMVLAGIFLVVLVLVAPYIGLPATFAIKGTVGTLLLGMGISLTLSGVAAMLAPTSKFDQTEKPENMPSYIFNGTVNTYRQGNPIPVGFGRMIVGSQIVAAGIRAVDIDVRNP